MFSYNTFRATSRLCLRCQRSFTISTALRNEATPKTPPMLAQIRTDLKTAMRAKDTPRLNVLRSVLTATLNASKTSSPITTDQQLLALLRKNAASAKDAAAGFRAAGREDLAEKEESQEAVMAEYMEALQGGMVGVEEIREIVSRVVQTAKEEAKGAEIKMGEVMKMVFGPDGLGDRAAEKSEVAKIVKELIGAK